jgi:small subunit ribosomal protein S21
VPGARLYGYAEERRRETHEWTGMQPGTACHGLSALKHAESRCIPEAPVGPRVHEEPYSGEKERMVMVRVIDQQLDKALRLLKRKLARDGTWRELKARAFYEKPSVKKRRRQRAVRRRLLKLEKTSVA